MLVMFISFMTLIIFYFKLFAESFNNITDL